VSDTGNAVSLSAAAARNLMRIADFLPPPYLTGTLLVALHPRGKRLGDMVAGTYVVRQRFHLPSVRPATMPPQLAAWAASADVAPLPDGLALAARQFLDRAPTLNPASRAALAAQLATQALTRVAPPPPAGHHPETVLAAVLAERRRRDELRLARDEQLRARLRSHGRR